MATTLLNLEPNMLNTQPQLISRPPAQIQKGILLVGMSSTHEKGDQYATY